MMTAMTVATVQKTTARMTIVTTTVVVKAALSKLPSLNKHLRMLIFLPVIFVYTYIDFFRYTNTMQSRMLLVMSI